MMKRIDDMKLWHEAALDTRFSAAPGSGLREGVHVKSKELMPNSHWPRFYGIVVFFNEEKDNAVVRSMNDEPGGPSPAGTVWTGTNVDELEELISDAEIRRDAVRAELCAEDQDEDEDDEDL